LNPWLWAILFCVITVLAVVEFALLARRPRILAPAEALAGTGLWVVAAGIFAFVTYSVYENNWLGIETVFTRPSARVELDGATALAQFITVYIAETALSLDNIAALALLLAFYKVPQSYAARVLFWAVTVSLVMRLALIGAVGPLSLAVDWLHYVFAGLLLVAVVRILLLPDADDDVGRGVIPRLIARIVPVSPVPDGLRLTTRITDPATGRVRWALTPLTAVVLVIALADFTYAADFLPAAFTITKDPFVAFAGNAFALLTLRSLYFTIAPFMGRFRYLKLSLVFIMLYIAVNTLFFFQQRRAEEVTLGVVCGVLLIGVLASVLVNKRRGLPKSVVHPTEAHGPYEFRPAPIDDLKEAAAATKRNFRKVCILIAGTAVIIFGIIIAPLPGPGPTILVPIGIAILATEFIWAKRLLDQLKEQGDRLARYTDRLSASIPVWVAWLAVVLWPCVWAGLWWLLKSHGHPKWAALVAATGFGTSFPFVIWAWRKLRKK
jgi:tellurite resistance protein TerC